LTSLTASNSTRRQSTRNGENGEKKVVEEVDHGGLSGPLARIFQTLAVQVAPFAQWVQRATVNTSACHGTSWRTSSW
jgi:hypothetical protein